MTLRNILTMAVALIAAGGLVLAVSLMADRSLAADRERYRRKLEREGVDPVRAERAAREVYP